MFYIALFYVLSLLSTSVAQAFDNEHFYRANFFWGEPRFERPYLSSFDIFVEHGTSLVGRNCEGNKTSILNIYGPTNLLRLGEGITDLDNSFQDTTIAQCATLPGRGSFGLAEFAGKFSITEALFDYKQNIDKGFFVHMALPIRSISISNIVINDLSPCDGTFPDCNNQSWKNMLLFLNPILEHHGLSAGATHSRGLGDFTFMLGWAINHQNTTFLDYVDLSFQLGFLAPTGKAKKENQVFSLPLGNNKHWAIPCAIDASIGIWEWLTIGINGGAYFFFPNTRTIHMKTSFDQNGLIKLAQGKADIHPGIASYFGLYIKGDHFNETFSYTLGYSYNTKGRDIIYPRNSQEFSAAIVNSDSTFGHWTMHTIHGIFEIDCARYEVSTYPRVRLFINTPVAGERIFDTTVGGLDMGLDITWAH